MAAEVNELTTSPDATLVIEVRDRARPAGADGNAAKGADGVER